MDKNRNTTYHCLFANCDKEFNHKSKMVDHINSHTNYKRFQCVKCNSRFVKVSRVQRHIIQHNSKAQLECTECNKTFATRDNLKRHQLKCGVFECEACGVKLGSNREYYRHVMGHKEIEKVCVRG